MTAAPPSQGRSKWPFGLVVVLVIGIVVALVVANGGFGGGAAASVAPSSSVEGVIPADAGVVAEGRAVPVAWAEVTPAASGRVAAIQAKVGDSVAVGDTLLQIDDAAARLDVQAAAAAATGAAAATARAEASVAQASANVTAATAAIAQAQASRRSADAQRDQLPNAATRAQERQADAQVAQADAAIDSARAQRTAAQAALRIAEAGLEAAKADEERARIAVASAELALDHLTVTTPVAGTIVSIEPSVGDLVQAGVAVVRVADLSAWRFETSDLSETSIARVREGATALITVDGLPGTEIAGTVESVGGYGSASQGDIVFRVVVAPSGEVPEALRWNMTVTMEIDGVSAGS
ncbi:MAG TPA: HlyD family efflux transporter periplasmic adaptor subunit [Candidatus Limnocylindrales bacterium]|nr:HlyD family efflux transporter periplasmic adaptor subunit [Candidatus Limnocylindrales bacterium]